MDQIEQRVRLAGGGAGLAVLGLAIFEMVRSLGRPSGPQEGTAEAVLRRPLMLAAILYCFLQQAWPSGGRCR